MKFVIAVVGVLIGAAMVAAMMPSAPRVEAYAPCGTPLSMTAMPIPVWLNPDLTQYGTVSRADMNRELDIALASWANLPDSSITFYRTDVPVNGWYPRFSITPDAFVVAPAVARTQCPRGGYTQWMSVLSTYDNWDTNSADGITPGKLSLAYVLRHELGHALGLDESCHIAEALMCLEWSTAFPAFGLDRQIDPDAQSAMALFYGSGTPTPTASPTPTPTPAPTVTLCERVATMSDGTVVRTTLALTAC